MSTDSGASHQCQLILVEDSQDDAALLLTLVKLEEIDVEVQHFLDGESAYDHLKTLVSDKQLEEDRGLVLLDLNLPGMNGKEILKRLNERGGTGKITILVFSGSTNPADKEECLASGAKNYYVKPWDLDGYEAFIQGPFLSELKAVCPCL